MTLIGDFDLAVLGNGVLGYALAFAAVQESEDISVAIVGPVEIERSSGGPASLAAGAMLNSFAEVDGETLSTELSRYKFEVNLRATKMWPIWVETLNGALGRPALKLKLGTYILHNSSVDELDDETYAAIINALVTYDEPHKEVEASEVAFYSGGYSPAPQFRSLKALHIPNEGSFPSFAMLDAFREFCQKHPRITYVDDFSRRITIEDSGTKVVDMKRTEQRLTCKHVVIAAGAASQQLIETLPIRDRIQRIFCGVGLGLTLDTPGFAPKQVIRTVNRGLACGLHMVPHDDNSCYLGSTNVITPIPEYHPRAVAVADLLLSAMQQINTDLYKARVRKWRVGNRPITLDTMPLLGQTSIDGVWVLTGTRRDGIHIAPLVATSIVREMLGQSPLMDNRFAPERKLIHTMNRDEGIRKGVLHLRSAGYQHGLMLPKAGWEPRIEDMLRRHVEEVYDKCGITEFGIPPEMLDMYRYGHAGDPANWLERTPPVAATC